MNKPTGYFLKVLSAMPFTVSKEKAQELGFAPTHLSYLLECCLREKWAKAAAAVPAKRGKGRTFTRIVSLEPENPTPLPNIAHWDEEVCEMQLATAGVLALKPGCKKRFLRILMAVYRQSPFESCAEVAYSLGIGHNILLYSLNRMVQYKLIERVPGRSYRIQYTLTETGRFTLAAALMTAAFNREKKAQNALA